MLYPAEEESPHSSEQKEQMALNSLKFYKINKTIRYSNIHPANLAIREQVFIATLKTHLPNIFLFQPDNTGTHQTTGTCWMMRKNISGLQ